MAKTRRRRAPKRVSPESEAKNSDRFAKLAKVTSALKNWRPAAEVLTKVRSVPTIFPQFDRATRCGGYPIERVTLIHGRSNEGKTLFAHGLGLSFLLRSHFYALIDAEFTTPEKWIRNLLREQAENPGFIAKRPTSYEETVDSVRELVEAVWSAKNSGNLDNQTTALVAVDSIRKLVPKDFLANIAKQGARGKKGSVDGYRGRGAQLKAKMNGEWLDELTPMLYRTGTALLMIGREVDKSGADEWDRRKEEDWKLTGGKAIVFDSSLVGRISRDAWLKDGDGPIVGERFKIRIWKTKIGGKDDKHVDAFFHTSNGLEHPEGFWRSRDVLDLARFYDIISHTGGGWLKWGTFKKWQGERNAIKWLDANPEDLERLEGECRDRFEGDDLEQQIASIATEEK